MCELYLFLNQRELFISQSQFNVSRIDARLPFYITGIQQYQVQRCPSEDTGFTFWITSVLRDKVVQSTADDLSGVFANL